MEKNRKKFANNSGPVTESQILSAIYSPLKRGQKEEFYFFDTEKFRTGRTRNNELPLPPVDLRLGYGDSDEEFINSGKGTAEFLKSIISGKHIPLNANSAVMDWGCASGRVLRHFAKEAKKCEFWGVDPYEEAMVWAKENLSPPFRFVKSTAYPHLPFPDGKFSFIYGISVFTHIEHLQDMWLMEINRILKKGGIAVFTIHDENTIKYHIKKKEKPFYVPKTLDLQKILKHDITVTHLLGGESWKVTFTIFNTNWIKKEWSKYFEILEIKPYAERNGMQSAVILRKF